MTIPSPARPGLTVHELLLDLAGRIPDDQLAGARRRLAEDGVRTAVTGLTHWLAAKPVPLLAAELAAIRELADDSGALPRVRAVAGLPRLSFAFSEASPLGLVTRDAMDDAVTAVAQGHGAAGLWRAWRYRLDDPDAEPGAATVTIDPDDPGQAYRVYIVQVEQATVSQALCRDLLRAVDDTGRAGMEVIGLSGEPPAYQAMALAESLLLWAGQGDPEFDLAAVFDVDDPDIGPGFAAEHAVVTDAGEREQMLTYLRSGALVLATTATTDDVVDPDAGAVVPASFRTDGTWIWADAAEYYLGRYGLAPDAGLGDHIRRQLASGELVPLVDDETADRAAEFLLYPRPDSPGGGLTGEHRRAGCGRAGA
jgi:hypothetical protein